jgi:chemosensory pili system protein ChpA (sensor histidine kinase/response regulator)
MSEVSTQTLYVVARELTTELNEARAALEAFGEQQDDADLLRRCGDNLHQVQGALRLVEVYGAALLAEEMEQVTRYLVATFAEKRHLAEGLDALMRAMVQLPTYLERVLNGGRDVALVLLPLLNDLRAVRGSPLLSEGTLLLLNLTSDQPANPAPASAGEPSLGVAHWARKLRPRYQLGLLGWIRGERPQQNVEILARTAEKLEQVATTQAVFQFWWVVGALLEALRDGGVENSASVKRLLGQADREMRRLYEQGEPRYAEHPPVELLNNLLFYVARTRSSGPRVNAVRASFRLGELLPIDDQVEQARESLSAPSVRLMKTVAAAIKEDLGRVKDAFDLYVRSGGRQVDDLAPQLDLLQKIGDTLGVLGLGGLRDRVQGEIGGLQSIVAGGASPDESELLRMAATLIAVEDSLDEQLVSLIVPQTTTEQGSRAAGDDELEFRQVTEAVLRECIVNMARIKEAVALSVERPGEAQALDQVPQLIRGITAGLLMLGKTRAVEVTEGIAAALGRYARPGGERLDQERMDRLADAIVSVEYYMETLQAGRTDPWYMLDNAERCLAVLEVAAPVVDLPTSVEPADASATVLLDTVPTPIEESHERTQVIDRARPGTPPPVRLPPVLETAEEKVDPEFLELFIEEANDEVARIAGTFPAWDQNPQDVDALVNMRRSFHTLKGSGRMVGARLIGEFGWAIENLLNRVINRTLDRSPAILGLMRDAIAALPQLIEQLETGRAPATDVAALVARAHELAGGPPIGATPRPAAPVSEPVSAPPPASVEPTASPAAPGQMDATLHEIFSKEIAGHLAAITEFVAAAERSAPPYPVTESLHRSCHTLSGTAKTAGARHGIRIAEPLNHYVRKLFDNGMGLPNAGLAVLSDAVAAIEDVVGHIDEDTGYFVSHEAIAARIRDLETQLDAQLAELAAAAEATIAGAVPGLDTDALEAIAMSLSDELRERPAAAADHAADETAERQEPAGAQAEPQEAPVSEEPRLEADADAHAISEPEAVEWFDDSGDAAPVESHDEEREPELIVETAAWAATFEPPTLDELDIAAGGSQSQQPVEPAGQTAATPAPPVAVSPSVTEVSPPPKERVGDEPYRVEPAATEEFEATSGAPADAVEIANEDFDPDVAAIFTEEANELLDAADAALAAWMVDRGNQALVFELKRALHTLKGGARMAGIRAMGDLSHELESFMIAIEGGQLPASEEAFAALQASLDELHRMRESVQHHRALPRAQGLIERIRALMRPAVAAAVQPTEQAGPPVSEPAAVTEESQPPLPAPAAAGTPPAEPDWPLASWQAEPEPAAPAVDEPAAEAIAAMMDGTSLDVAAMTPELPPDTGAEAEAAALPPGREAPAPERHDVARVDAELLDTLLNNAGEVSICRSRLEQQVSSIEFNLAELGRTVTRLKDQLRKLELETEAQILHRHRDESQPRDDFDPLELDRYSTIQQHSRALAESVSDVASIEGLLENLTREAQNLLLQEARVVTELQNGLMRTRMVPFQRHVQRLGRIVRQVASDTGKRAELVVQGASGELDRQVLERMMPPFEHMLRNAVVHGIESPAERQARGKPETGTIRVSLRREGAEMVITIEDDGRGIDVEAVRARARARGLIEPGRVLSDEEALQLVLEPGFSTASAVTQHAGRGVGMDVVVTEIKKLGGALFTRSTPGAGTSFSIRLPFTLAISQALIVRIGDELYALPLPTVEGVTRVPARDVARHLAEEVPTYEYSGQTYHFQHLGLFVGGPQASLPQTDVSLPVILIRAGEHSTAVVTDELVGSREIVVKSVGPQVAGIRGISGATILGDGRIVIILDMGALVRSEWRTRTPAEALRPVADRRTFALVVDDSITVRRVTQRLLERNGMRVMTAKDGVDALSLLQEHVPDVILLDIEMPRMDGYELASHVRNDARLADIPIVMITSRAGEKHRARAIELGVDDYLSKPYQENQLLDAIEPLVQARRNRAAARAGGER